MRRWETLSALAAVALASLGSIPGIPMRWILTAVAVVLISIVGVARLAGAMRRSPGTKPSFDPAERARLIREQRGRDR